MIWQHNDNLFPNDTPLQVDTGSEGGIEEQEPAYFGIVDIVHFVKDDKLHIPNQIGSFIQHAPQNLSRHDQTVGFRVNLHVPCQNAH